MFRARLSRRSAYTVVESLVVIAILAVLATITTAVVQKAQAPSAPAEDGTGAAGEPVSAIEPNPVNGLVLAPVNQFAPLGGPSCAQATPSTISGLIYSSPVGSHFWRIPVSAGVTYSAAVSNLAPGAVGAIGELWVQKPGFSAPTYSGFLWGSDAGSPAGTWRFTPPQDGLMCLRVTGVDVMIVQGP